MAVSAVPRDADDNHVNAVALAARADLIVSGDSDLIVLQQFDNIPSSTLLARSRCLTPRIPTL
jgi:predicted nucleic acid-binding protein